MNVVLHEQFFVIIYDEPVIYYYDMRRVHQVTNFGALFDIYLCKQNESRCIVHLNSINLYKVLKCDTQLVSVVLKIYLDVCSEI